MGGLVITSISAKTCNYKTCQGLEAVRSLTFWYRVKWPLFQDDKRISLNENGCTLVQSSLNCEFKGQINNMAALAETTDWRRTGAISLSFFIPWPFRPKGYCRCLRLSVCPSVRPSVRLSVRLSVHKLYLVRAIIRHRFELESPNLHQICILGYPRLVLKMEVIDLDLQGRFGHFDLEF